MSFGIMSHSALCRIQPYVVRLCVVRRIVVRHNVIRRNVVWHNVGVSRICMMGVCWVKKDSNDSCLLVGKKEFV